MWRGRWPVGARRETGVPQTLQGKRDLMDDSRGSWTIREAHGRGVSTVITAGSGTLAAGAEGCSSVISHFPNDA